MLAIQTMNPTQPTDDTDWNITCRSLPLKTNASGHHSRPTCTGRKMRFEANFNRRESKGHWPAMASILWLKLSLYMIPMSEPFFPYILPYMVMIYTAASVRLTLASCVPNTLPYMEMLREQIPVRICIKRAPRIQKIQSACSLHW